MKRFFYLLLLMLIVVLVYRTVVGTADNGARDITKKVTKNTINGVKRVKDFGHYYAIFIAIQNYDHLKKLHSPLNDAEDIAQILEKRYGFEKPLIIKDPENRDTLVKPLRKYLEKIKKGDNLLIYYAGHGSEENGAGYWQLKNALNDGSTVGWISVKDAINNTLRGLEAQHILVVADSCYSGALCRSIPKKSLKVSEESKRFYSRIFKIKSRKVLTSGSDEPVMDGDGEGGKHSIFAKFLIDKLKSNKKAFFRMSEIFPTIQYLTNLNSMQMPQYQNLRFSGVDGFGGEMIFIDYKYLYEKESGTQNQKQYFAAPVESTHEVKDFFNGLESSSNQKSSNDEVKDFFDGLGGSSGQKSSSKDSQRKDIEIVNFFNDL